MSATARPGRPRDDAAEHAILDAVMDLLSEHGFAALTMSGVAARAGVGKPTVYRRWPSKSELVIDAVVRLAGPITARRSGDPHTDLRRLIRVAIGELTSPPLGTTMITLMADMHFSPELLQLVQSRVTEPRRQVLGEVIRTAIAAGELVPGTDPELMLDLLLGPLLYRWLTTGQLLSRTAVDRVVDTVWESFAVART